MIVASRTLRLIKDNITTDVVIELGGPEPDEGAWTCHYDFHWPDGRVSSFATGVDEVQALHLALQRIGFDLYRSPHHRDRAGHLVWEQAGDGYGFPVPKNARHLLIGSDITFEG